MPIADFIKGYSYSVLKINPYDFSLWDWWVCYSVYWVNEHIKGQGDWERARFIAFHARLAPHVKTPKKFSDIVDFEWEKKAKRSKALSKAEFYELKEKLFNAS